MLRDVALSTSGPVLHMYLWQCVHAHLLRELTSIICVKLGKSAAETLEILQQAGGSKAMSQARCSEWHSRFKRGRNQGDTMILTRSALNFFWVHFESCALEAFLERDTEYSYSGMFALCSSLRSIVKLQMCLWMSWKCMWHRLPLAPAAQTCPCRAPFVCNRNSFGTFWPYITQTMVAQWWNG